MSQEADRPTPAPPGGQNEEDLRALLRRLLALVAAEVVKSLRADERPGRPQEALQEPMAGEGEGSTRPSCEVGSRTRAAPPFPTGSSRGPRPSADGLPEERLSP
jgi:hypothetical protein